MSRADCLSLIRLRPGALRLAPWAAAAWLAAFLVIFAQPCCYALATGSAAAAGMQHGAADSAGGHQHGAPAGGDHCVLDRLPAQAPPAVKAAVHSRILLQPAIASTQALVPPQYAFADSRVAAHVRPPGHLSAVYLSTQRLRI